MVVLNGKFDGKNIIVENIPADIKPDTPVRVIFEQKPDPTGLESLIGILDGVDLPTDFASQFAHYTKGTPKRY